MLTLGSADSSSSSKGRTKRHSPTRVGRAEQEGKREAGTSGAWAWPGPDLGVQLIKALRRYLGGSVVRSARWPSHRIDRNGGRASHDGTGWHGRESLEKRGSSKF